MFHRLWISVVLWAGLLVGSLSAATIRVPADYSTIGEALSNAVGGDEVLVSPGTYLEHSLVVDDFVICRSVGGAAVTIINAQMLGYGVSVREGTLEGFTVRNAKTGVHVRDALVKDCIVKSCSNTNGGGIYVHPSWSTLAGNIIKNCSATEDGGGMYLVNCQEITLTNNTIRNNSAGCAGAGIWMWSTNLAVLDGNIIEGNHFSAGPCSLSGFGGGIYAVDCDDLSLRNNLISNNTGRFTAGVRVKNSHTVPQTRLQVEDNEFRNNRVSIEAGGLRIATSHHVVPSIHRNLFDSNDGNEAGGLWSNGDCSVVGNTYCDNTGRGAVLLDQASRIEHNHFVNNWGSLGAGLYVEPETGVRLEILSNLFAGNHYHTSRGGGLYLFLGTALLDGNTFIDNRSGLGAGLLVHSARVTVRNSIFWGNQPQNGSPTSSGSSLAMLDTDGPANSRVLHSNVQGGQSSISAPTGTSLVWLGGMISADPQFTAPAAGDYSLQSGSPCVDAGITEFPFTDRDAAGGLRLLDSDLDGVVEMDMGAFERNNVTLGVTGSLTPGGVVTLTLDGPPMVAWLFAGLAGTPTPFHTFGDLWVGSPLQLFTLGSLPHVTNITVASSFPAPLTVSLQALGFDALTLVGNLSTPLELLIE
jgi:parallel beta-helix repeat protein